MANRFVRQSQEDPLYLEEDELDAIRALLVTILMKDTNLDKEEIFTYIFGSGRKILWN
ncbi:MAG TPA: hypothetical protein VN328_10415 [Thermodesulfovibrionales bacterium]|nr:hypothetical protein [Thermodesulfovibrionales bacterium]